MTRASELKKSDVIEVNGTLYAIRQIEVQSPSARGAATLYRVKASAVGGGPKFEERFKGDDDVATVELQRRPVQFSYVDGDDYIFMDNEDFSQYLLKQEDISDELAFITEETEGVLALRVEESVIGLELPASVVLEVTETTPGHEGCVCIRPHQASHPEYRPGSAGAGIYRGRGKGAGEYRRT